MTSQFQKNDPFAWKYEDLQLFYNTLNSESKKLDPNHIDYVCPDPPKEKKNNIRPRKFRIRISRHFRK